MHRRQSFFSRLSRIGKDHGFFDRIGPRHMALFVQESDTLVLSFDRADRLWDQGDRGLPLGFDAVLAHEYSLLSVLAAGRTWFRDAHVEAFMKTLARDGFFRSFSTVLILASEPDCTHAAARAARLIPDARVLLCNPVTAIGPAAAPFEDRFRATRRNSPDFPPPVGAAALSTAAQIWVLFDGTRKTTAAQAAMLSGPATTLVNLPHTGPALSRAMAHGPALVGLTDALAEGTLTPARARRILRPTLRRDEGYLSRLARAALATQHPARAAFIRKLTP